MARSQDNFEFWFWIILGFIGGTVGGVLASVLGSPIWIGIFLGVLIAWGFPVCFHLMD